MNPNTVTTQPRTSNPTAAPNPDTTKPKTTEKDPTLWSIIAPVNRAIHTAMALSAISVICWFAAIMLMWPALNELTATSPNHTKVWTYLGYAALSVIGAFTLRVISFQISHQGAFKLEEILRTELSEHLAKIPLGYIINTGSGALKKVVLDDVRALHVFVADSTPLFAKAFATPILGTILLFIVDWRLALASLALFPLGMVGMSLAFKDYDEARKKVDNANENINAVIIEYIQGMQVVRTFDDGSGSLQRFRTALAESTEVLKQWTGKTQIGAYIARTLFAALPTVSIVLGVGIWLYTRDQITIPQIVLALALAPTITESIVPLVWLQQYIVNSSAAVKRLNALQKVPTLPEISSATSKKPASTSVELKGVSFCYDGRDDNALTDVSFHAPAGKVTALVGPSGSGKSTIAQLVVRFWDTTEGEVLIGGVNVKDMTADTLMGHVAFVFQSPFLINDTIRENIKLGKPDATDKEIEQAAQAAQVHDFVTQDLPDGYDTIVGERGTTMSGGQRQRITIARAILQDSPIIVLDEATAFSDPDNEAKIHQALSALAKGRTIIVVAHRLSTIRDAHQIVVLKDGRVDEVGTHDTLAAGTGTYASLWNNFEKAQNWALRQPKPDDNSDKTTGTSNGTTTTERAN